MASMRMCACRLQGTGWPARLGRLSVRGGENLSGGSSFQTGPCCPSVPRDGGYGYCFTAQPAPGLARHVSQQFHQELPVRNLIFSSCCAFHGHFIDLILRNGNPFNKRYLFRPLVSTTFCISSNGDFCFASEQLVTLCTSLGGRSHGQEGCRLDLNVHVSI